jgi:FeS assembly SUF system protein
MTMHDDTPHALDQGQAKAPAKEERPAYERPAHEHPADEDFRAYDPYAMGGEPPKEGTTVRAGAPKDPGVPVATEEAVVEALRTVYDPEIPVNIYDLGLIYDLKIEESGDATVTMTLTAPACPVAGSMPKEVAERVAAVEGIGEVDVVLTWDPPWTPANMSEVAKVALDMF